MPTRTIPFVNGQIYHIYNRGTEKRRIFETRRDYLRFLKTMHYYQLEGPKPKLSNFFKYMTFKEASAKKIVTILAYCLMPNHFHLLLKQQTDGSITEMMTKLSLSYTKYFNKKYDRVGPLLQGQFKAVLVENDEQLMHLSRYIHLNPLVAYLTKNLSSYEWSSYNQFVTEAEGMAEKDEILSFFKNSQTYAQFVHDQINYARELDKIKHQQID